MPSLVMTDLDTALDTLQRSIRRATAMPEWKRGTNMARDGAVIGERVEDDEVELKVTTGRGPLALSVSLYPQDDEWDCSCASRANVCEHVVAAILALRQAREEGLELPGPTRAVGHVRYHLSRSNDALVLSRTMEVRGTSMPLHTSLTEAAAGRIATPPVAISTNDLDVEQVLGIRTLRHDRVPIHKDRMPGLLKALASCRDVVLEGDKVTCSARPLAPVAEVSEEKDGFHVQLTAGATLSATFSNGAALSEGLLRPLWDGPIPRHLLRGLFRGRTFGADSMTELMTEVLPLLRRHLKVEVTSGRLPGISDTPPRLMLTSGRKGKSLSIIADIVYGDPVIARLVDGRLEVTGTSVPIRDEGAEARLERELSRALGLSPGVSATLDGEEAVRFTRRLRSWDGDLSGSEHELYTQAPALQPELILDGDNFEVTFTTPDGRQASTSAVFERWQGGGSMAPLTGGGWSALPEDFLKRHGRLVADLLEAQQEDGTLPTFAIPDLARLCDAEGMPSPPGLDRLQGLLGDFDGLPESPLPDDLTATLRDYQRRGTNWLSFLRRAGLGGLLADDMGLGKTLQGLCAIQGRTLVVAPTSVLRNWEKEALRFRPGLSVCVYHGPKRQLSADADLIITSYGLLRLDIEELRAEHWDMAILDEAQAIKNPNSQVARAAFKLNADFRLTLTGTPVENRLDELWSQLNFVNPGLLGTRKGFQERYAKPISQGESGVASALRARIRPFLLRRLKREVAPELPPKIETVLHVTLTEEERAAYDAVRATTQKEIVDQLGQGANPIQALAALMRLRQAACHKGLLPKQEAATSSKVQLLVETLDSVIAQGHKALVFSQWTSLLDRVEPHLEAADMPFIRLDGATRDRAGVVDAFQSDDGPPLMLISLKAGGTGLNLTAADHVFLMDPWWNPAVEDQAADRAHRIGQDRPVIVTRLVTLETVEERILALQSRKRALADAALAGADRAAALTRDDLLALLA